MNTITTLVGALALSGVPTTSDGESKLDDVADVNTNINITLPVDTTVTAYGRIDLSGVWGSGDAPFDTIDTVGFRRARLGAKGNVGIFNYKAEYDFAGGDADFADVYLAWGNSPLGEARVGHFRESVGLESLTSSRFVTFAQRAVTNVLVPFRNTGVQFADHTDMLSWQYGVFGGDTDSFGNGAVDGMYGVTGRLTGLLLDDDTNKLHLGISASNRSQSSARISSGPEVPFVDDVADTGALINDGILLYGVEAAWVGGPWSAQGEYIAADISDAGGVEDATYGGYYVEGSYYVTGESRNYDQTYGIFGRPPVNEDFDGEGGMGAIQLAARYSMLDLDDGPTMDELAGFTLGVNWFLNDHMRVTLNYVNSAYEAGSIDEDANYLVVRFLTDF